MTRQTVRPYAAGPAAVRRVASDSMRCQRAYPGGVAEPGAVVHGVVLGQAEGGSYVCGPMWGRVGGDSVGGYDGERTGRRAAQS
jgi:hypothetical protein